MLAGGTGGALLAAGMQALLPAGDLTVIANTGDDDEFWDLLVCPDVDAVIYRLAGVFNDRAGYGVKDDTFEVLDALKRLGEITWFHIGDKDLATHVLRTALLREGTTLTQVTHEPCERFDVSTRVLPMTNDPVRARFTTEAGELSFQEYYVRERLRPKLLNVHFDGGDSARPSLQVLSAVQEADLVVIGPSNPVVSIGPIVHLIRADLVRERTVAVTPIVGGAALKGPTVEMMRSLRMSPEPREVARLYSDVAGTFVLDERDRDSGGAIEELGYRVLVCDTVMKDGGVTLARAVLGDV